MSEDKSPTCIADCKAVLGEGPVWVEREQALYWVDIKGLRIFRRDAAGEVRSWETPYRICSLAPRASDGFIAGTAQGFASIDPAEGRYDILFDPEPERRSNRFNDGKIDRSGCFWAGTMDDDEAEASGALYRLDPSLDWVKADDHYRVTNGPAFSPDGQTAYHSDSALRTIYAFDLDEGGALANRRIFARFTAPDGYPDGMTVDAEGCLWVAFWDGWCVRRFSPEGEMLHTLPLPVERPTSCAFGGPHLDELFVTSARIGLNEEALSMQPYAGGLFLLKPGVNGIAELPFAG